MGGPFVSYFFEKEGIWYFLDGHVFAPGKKKWPFLEVRALIEQEAQGYESPAEVVKWFYMQPQRLSEMEGLALEGNVVNWVLSKAKVVDKAVSFDELMGGGS